MSGIEMNPGSTSMIACPRLSATKGMPAIDRRNATSSAKNIASAPTSIPVRARRSKRPMYGTIRRVVRVAPSPDTRRLVRVSLPHGCADLALRQARRVRREAVERETGWLPGRDLAGTFRWLASGDAAHERSGSGLIAAMVAGRGAARVPFRPRRAAQGPQASAAQRVFARARGRRSAPAELVHRGLRRSDLVARWPLARLRGERWQARGCRGQRPRLRAAAVQE